jgi:hypothetical protein
VVAALLMLVLAVRVARALLRLVVIVALALGLLWGYGGYRHIGSLDAAARQIAAQVRLSAGDPNTTMPQLLAQAHAALVEAGLDPGMLRITMLCVQGQTSLVLSETRVPLSPAVACGGAP